MKSAIHSCRAHSRAARLFACTLLATTTLTSTAYAKEAEASGAASAEEEGNGIAEGSAIVVTATKPNIVAPVTTSLATTQPQAIVSRSFIEESLPTTSDFNQVALISPSVSNFGGNNGVGLSESKGQIRGFQDGEYNITYDGVPFGDQNDPTHHSNTFWPSNTIETLVVDRGPGNASQLGQATFGGNVNMFAREARDQFGMELVGSYGTFNTYVGQAVLQSGEIESLGGLKAVGSVQYVKSDGALSNEKYKQLNVFGKVVIPFSPDVNLTLLATANRNDFHQPDNDGITLAQATFYGQRYSLSTDPNRQDYFDYNTTLKRTDFYIAKFEANIAPGTVLENRAFSYAYDNETLSGLDTTQPGLLAGQVPGGVIPSTVSTTNRVVLGLTATGAKLPAVYGVPGYTKSNKYRVYGDILKARIDFGFGTLTAGAWIEWSHTFRQQTEVNLLTGAFNYRNSQQLAPATGLNPGAITPGYIRFNQNSAMNHSEEFAELELRPFGGFKITPGIKHVDFNRKIDAAYNQTTRYAQRLSKTYTATLPFLTVNYQPTDNLAIYAQYARGFLMPPLSQLYVARPELSTADPQRSTNYQAGFVYHGSHMSVDADAYLINFTNKFSSSTSTIPGEGVIFTNLGGARYKGIEGQVTYAFDNGLAVFGNASVNYAKVTSLPHTQVAKAPKMTAALGLIYKHGPIRFSLIDKHTGVQYGAEGELAAFRIAPYDTAIFAASYDFGKFRIGVKVSDLFDSTKITNISGTQYFFQPGRQITGEVKVKF
jgi:iron complex outermembrane recepter protein